MESFPQDRMTAVNNYFAIILDPAVFREVASPSASPSVGPAAAGVTAAGETVVEAAAGWQGQGQDDLRDVSTARLEAELAARKRLPRSSSGGDEQAAAAARAAFEQEAQVLADWVTSSSPAAPIDYEVEPGALPPVPAPGNIYVTPLRFKLGGRHVLSARFNVETAGSERKRPEI